MEEQGSLKIGVLPRNMKLYYMISSSLPTPN